MVGKAVVIEEGGESGEGVRPGLDGVRERACWAAWIGMGMGPLQKDC